VFSSITPSTRHKRDTNRSNMSPCHPSTVLMVNNIRVQRRHLKCRCEAWNSSRLRGSAGVSETRPNSPCPPCPTEHIGPPRARGASSSTRAPSHRIDWHVGFMRFRISALAFRARPSRAPRPRPPPRRRPRRARRPACWPCPTPPSWPSRRPRSVARASRPAPWRS